MDTMDAESSYEGDNVNFSDFREKRSNQQQPSADGRTLRIINELNGIYETRLKDIEKEARGDAELKCVTYKEWVKMLLRIINDLLYTLEGLENEACHRLGLLERKLRIECTPSHTSEKEIKSDVSNLIELIRRAIEEKRWNTEGLQFHTITEDDIFGGIKDKGIPGDYGEMNNLSSELICKTHLTNSIESEKNYIQTDSDVNNSQLSKLEQQSNLFSSKCSCKIRFGEEASDVEASDSVDKVFKACIAELRKLLQEKESMLAECFKKNECLKSELNLMKSKISLEDKTLENVKALAIEVAEKHDQIQQLRNQIFSLEEDLKSAEKKIQFKDNVIKELRRDCKNITKICSCMREKIPSSSTQSATPDVINSYPSYIPSHTSDYPEMSNTTNTTLDSAVGTESSRMRNYEQEETETIKKLQKELDDLFSTQIARDKNIEAQQQTIVSLQGRIKEMVSQLLSDLNKAKNKLCYVRNQLMAIRYGSEPNLSIKDSGYTSQDDLEPECSIIQNIRDQMYCLKLENDDLKYKIQQMQLTTPSGSSNICKNEQTLKAIACTLSDMSGEHGEQILHQTNPSCEICEQGLHQQENHFCETIMSLENEIVKKDDEILDLSTTLTKAQAELKDMISKNYALQNEIKAKEQIICDFKETVTCNNSSIEFYELCNAKLEAELKSYKDTEKNYKQIIAEKEKLQIECENQLTTISNLREALEASKRDNPSVSGNKSSSSSNNNKNNNLFGGWWRNNVHDV